MCESSIGNSPKVIIILIIRHRSIGKDQIAILYDGYLLAQYSFTLEIGLYVVNHRLKCGARAAHFSRRSGTGRGESSKLQTAL